MSRGMRRRLPALIVAGLALVAALSGTVYAAGKISGKTIKVKSLPGNRLALGSVPGNRLKPGAIGAAQLAPGAVTGIHINASSLGQVPSALHAQTAQSARDAETALNAATAQNAKTVNGYTAGCKVGTEPFAGACWDSEPSTAAGAFIAAAASCAGQGGELPDALSLVAFSQQPGEALAEGDEWTNEIPVLSGEDLYSVVTVSPSGLIKSAASTATKKFRCVIPILG